MFNRCFITLCLFLYVASTPLQSQVIYAGIAGPTADTFTYDTTICYFVTSGITDTVWLDLNQDGADDFFLRMNSFPWHMDCMAAWARLHSMGNNETAHEIPNYDTKRFITGDSIHPGLNWLGGPGYIVLFRQEGGCPPVNVSIYDGEWVSRINDYAAVRLVGNATMCMGWLEMSVENVDSYFCITLHRGAFQTDCQATGSDGLEEAQPGLLVYPNPSNEFLNVTDISNNPDELDGMIADAAGRIVQRFRITRAVPSISIQTSAWPAGIYMIIARQGDAYRRQSLMVTH